jgi:AbrB family looped-hinge helix DNA binding protein
MKFVDDIIVLQKSVQEIRMNAVTVSSKFRVVTPKKVRNSLNIQPGQKLQVIEYGKNIVLIPVRPIQEARGSSPDIDINPQREKQDREL